MKQILIQNGQLFILALLLFVGAGLGGELVGIVLVGLAAILLKRRGWVSELFILFLIILVFSDNRIFLFDFAENGKIVYIVLLFGFFLFDRSSLPIQSRVFNYFIPFLSIALVLVYWSEEPFIAFQKTISYGLILLLVPNYFLEAYHEEGSIFLKKLLYTVLVILSVGLLLYPAFPEFAITEGRYRGMFGNPNGVGIFSALSFIFFTVVLHIYPNLFSKHEKWVFYGVFFLSLYLCASRSALFTIFIFLGFLPIYRSFPFLGFIAFLVLVMGSQYITTNLPSIVRSLGLEEYFRVKTLEEGSGRFIAWNFAWQHIKENMAFGKGFNHTVHLFGAKQEYLNKLGHQGNAHNSFLTFWLDTGLYGLMAYLIAFFTLFIKAGKQHPIAVPAMFGFLFSATFESWLTASLNPYTIIFLMTIALLTYPVEETEEEDD
ncbi:MAG: O-antigen ligase family protein, partial [Flavobacteriales bacterium]